MRFYPEWDFLVTWRALGVSTGLYLAGMLLLWRWARSSPRRELRGFMLVYNALQIGLCGWMSWAFARAAFSWSNPMALGRAYSVDVELVMLVHFLSKWLDYCDTGIMLLKHNWHQVSFLHVYHHASIALVWGYLLQAGDANGTAYFGAFLNSVVHLLMYTHYFVTALGIRNPLKGLLTTLQMVQFGLCLLHASCVALWETVLPPRLALLQLAYHSIMLLLFANFIRESKQRDAAARKAKKT